MILEATTAETNGQPLRTAASQCLISNIHAIKGSLSQAEETLEIANNIYRRQPSMQDRVLIVLAHARIEAARGHFESAFEHYENVLNMLDRMEGRWWHARITVEQGVLLLKRNDPEDVDQAQGLFREALSELKALDVHYYPDVVIEKLREVKQISRAQAIAHRKITRELAEAGRIQNTIIPTKSPDIPGYQISGVLLPARETSGDFFDFFNISDDQHGFVIADVGDKGAGAALYMAMSRTLIRTYAVENKLPPEEVIQHVNRRILTDTERGIFLTVAFGILDSQKARFTFVNAGHNPPIHIQQHNNQPNLVSLEKTGTLVGIFKENKWEANAVELKPGDYLVLYTDGVTEAQNEKGDFFGNERLMQCLEDNVGKSSEILRNLLLEKVQQFIGSSPRLDDITLIVIHRETLPNTSSDS
jgi:serine phosphatase RsbU (regulator of sigma subunit)